MGIPASILYMVCIHTWLLQLHLRSIASPADLGRAGEEKKHYSKSWTSAGWAWAGCFGFLDLRFPVCEVRYLALSIVSYRFLDTAQNPMALMCSIRLCMVKNFCLLQSSDFLVDLLLEQLFARKLLTCLLSICTPTLHVSVNDRHNDHCSRRHHGPKSPPRSVPMNWTYVLISSSRDLLWAVGEHRGDSTWVKSLQRSYIVLVALLPFCHLSEMAKPRLCPDPRRRRRTVWRRATSSQPSRAQLLPANLQTHKLHGCYLLLRISVCHLAFL